MTDRQAMQKIMQVLGPEPTCACAGCAWETGEALRLLREQGIAYQGRRRRDGPPHDPAAEDTGNRVTWSWSEKDGTWTIHGKDCWIWMQARPPYCDRGAWLAHVELKPVPAEQQHRVDLDGADRWPRYYFDLRRAKAECEAWLTKRQQWVEEQ